MKHFFTLALIAGALMLQACMSAGMGTITGATVFQHLSESEARAAFGDCKCARVLPEN